MTDSASSSFTENGLKAFALLQNWLETEGWYPQLIEGTHAFWARYSLGPKGMLMCTFELLADIEQFVFYAVPGVTAPEADPTPVLRYLARANYGLRLGNFECDLDDGEIRFKSSLNFAGEPLSTHQVANVVLPAIETVDKYLEGLAGVIAGACTPEEAIEQAEGGDFYLPY